MSFILEALRRADRERNRGQAPDVTAVYREAALPRRRRWPWVVLGGALLLNVFFFAAFFWPKAVNNAEDPISEPNQTSLAAQPSRQRVPLREEPVPVVRDRGPAATRAPVEVVPPRPKTPPKSVAVVEPARPPEDESPAEPSVATPPRIDPVEAFKAVQPTRDTPEPVAATDGTSPPEPAEPSVPERIDAAPALIPPVEEVEETPVRKPDERIPLVSELPLDVRQRLEKLRIDGHVYTDDRSRRFVFINMRTYREGDQIEEDGPVLEAVTADGAVVDYGEGRARLQIER